MFSVGYNGLQCILIIFYYPLHSTLYVLPSTFYSLRSTSHSLQSTMYPVSPSTLYVLPAKSLQCSTLYLLSPSAWKVIEIFNFFNFLTETMEQHKGRLLVTASFFVYFRHALSLSDTSSGNDLSVPKFNFPWKKPLNAHVIACCYILGTIQLALTVWPPKYIKKVKYNNKKI